MKLSGIQNETFVRGSLSKVSSAIKDVRRNGYTVSELFALFSLCEDLKDSYSSFREKTPLDELSRDRCSCDIDNNMSPEEFGDYVPWATVERVLGGQS